MTLRLNGDSSGFTEIKAADAAGDNSIKLPASNGSANELLKNGGAAGELEYATGVSADTSGNVNATAIRGGGVSSTLDGAPLTSHLTTNRNALTIQRLDGISEGQTTGIMFRQEYTTGSGNGRRLGFFGIERASSNSGDQRANFVMELCPDNSTNVGASSPNSDSQLFRFTSSGRLQFLRSGGGIDFSGISSGNNATSTPENNLLDDYEEGLWIPTVYSGADNGAGGAPPLSAQAGKYTKIGNLVHAEFYIRFDPSSTVLSDGNHTRIGGLPFTQTNKTYGNVSPNSYSRGGGHTSYHSTTGDIVHFYGAANQTYFWCYINGDAPFYLGGANNTNISGDYFIGSYIYNAVT